MPVATLCHGPNAHLCSEACEQAAPDATLADRRMHNQIVDGRSKSRVAAGAGKADQREL